MTWFGCSPRKAFRVSAAGLTAIMVAAGVVCSTLPASAAEGDTVIPTGDNSLPAAVAVDTSYGLSFVAEAGASKVAVYDAEGKPLGQFSPLPSAAATDLNIEGVAVNSKTHRLYVTSAATNSVWAYWINPDGQILPSAAPVALPAGSAPEGVGVDPTTNTIYVADSGTGSVTALYDPVHSDPTILYTAALGAAAGKVTNVAVDTANHTAYVADGSNYIVGLNSSGQQTYDPQSGVVESQALGVDSALGPGGTIYAGISHPNDFPSITAIDGATGATSTHVLQAYDQGLRFSMLTVDPAHHTIFTDLYNTPVDAQNPYIETIDQNFDYYYTIINETGTSTNAGGAYNPTNSTMVFVNPHSNDLFLHHTP